MGFGNFFGFNRKNTVDIGGVKISFPVEGKALAKLTDSLTKNLQKKLLTEQDVYWFVVEFFDRSESFNETTRKTLADLPISLFKIEYLDMRSEHSYVGKKNPGITYFEEAISTPIKDKFPYADNIIDQYITALIYRNFCIKNKNIINSLRIKYATHYYNNCIENAHFDSADNWLDVISSLE